MNELALFAGAGGGILGGALLGWSTVCACEIEKYPRSVLLARQRDGLLPRFPIWDDVTTFDGKPWRGLVDIVTGGFPCQDISCAGKGAGITGARSGLWSHMLRIICDVRPCFAFMENSPLLTSRGLGAVLGDLAESGYHAAWCCLSAAEFGAPHKRERIWILAADSLPNPCSSQCQGINSLPVLPQQGISGLRRARSRGEARHPWQAEPNVGRVADGVASRVDRLKAIGNGQVPLVAATAFLTLTHTLTRYINTL